MGELGGWLRQLGAVRDDAKPEPLEPSGPDDANRTRRLDGSKLMKRASGASMS